VPSKLLRFDYKNHYCRNDKIVTRGLTATLYIILYLGVLTILEYNLKLTITPLLYKKLITILLCAAVKIISPSKMYSEYLLGEL
jgi:hypothetical protein